MMQTISESEYEVMVDAAATAVFDPLESQSHDFSMRILDLVGEGRQEEAREKLKTRAALETATLPTPEGIDVLEAEVNSGHEVFHASILTHASHSPSPARGGFEAADENVTRASSMVREMAREAFYQDVKSEVFSRVRHAVSDD